MRAKCSALARSIPASGRLEEKAIMDALDLSQRVSMMSGKRSVFRPQEHRPQEIDFSRVWVKSGAKTHARVTSPRRARFGAPLCNCRKHTALSPALSNPKGLLTNETHSFNLLI